MFILRCLRAIVRHAAAARAAAATAAAVTAAAAALFGAPFVLAQDPVAVAPGLSTVTFDNDAVRVLRNRYPAGQQVPMHGHPARLVIPLADGKVRSIAPDGAAREVALQKGVVAWFEPTRHALVNTGDGPLDIIEVEFKAGPAPAGPGAPGSGASSAPSAAYDRLSSLAGTWTATAGTRSVPVSFRLVASGSALVETFGTTPGRETLTIFHLDGARLLATHYCAQRNQPRLQLDPASAADAPVFVFADATNLASPEASHLVRLAFRFADADHVTMVETYASKGVLDSTTYELVRQAGR